MKYEPPKPIVKKDRVLNPHIMCEIEPGMMVHSVIAANVHTVEMMNMLFNIVENMKERILSNGCNCPNCKEALIDLVMITSLNSINGKAN